MMDFMKEIVKTTKQLQETDIAAFEHIAQLSKTIQELQKQVLTLEAKVWRLEKR